MYTQGRASFTGGEGLPYDPYGNDIARRLSGASSSEDVISSLRSMNLGDDWWMFSFKVTPCCKSYSHKWTLCPCAHAGETARRRDPRLHPYRAVLCPLAKMKKACPMGDNCMWSHNVFEHWLHPSRYKTRLCSFGRGCNRPICFFAHSADELRTTPHMEDGADLDEREYLMHLMNSQPGLMPQRGLMHQASRAAPRMNFPNQHQANMANLNGLVMMNNPGGGGGGGGGHPQASMNSHRASSARDVSSTVTNNIGGQQQQQQQQDGQKQGGQKQQQQGNLDANSLLLGLQESLANLTMTVDGGWSSLAGGGQGQGQGRISDPGAGHQPHVNPMRHLNRISDSGQTLGLSSSKNLVNLETLLSSALANAISQQPLQQPLANAASVPNLPMSSSTQQMQGAASVDSQSCPLPTVTSQPGSPSTRGSAGPGPGASGSGSSGAAPGDSGVHDLIAQLQEQGIVTSKEQLVASLTQLLAQLLVTS